MSDEVQTGRTSGPVAKRRFRNFLIDKSFQLGWVLKVGLATAIIVGVMGYFLYGTLSESTDLMVGQALMTEGLAPEAQQAFIDKGQEDKTRTILVLAASLFGLVVLLSLMTIVATHKIAGPAYKMRKLFAGIDGDHYQLWAKLRKGDELGDVFQEFNDMMKRIREARHRDIEFFEKIIENLKSAGVSREFLDQMEEKVETYRSSVRMD